MSRKEFIIVFFRSIIFGGLTLLSGLLIFRELTDNEECRLDFVCRNCRKLKNCDIPEAIQYKQKKS